MRNLKEIVRLTQTDPILSTYAPDCMLLSSILKEETAIDWMLNHYVQIVGYNFAADGYEYLAPIFISTPYFCPDTPIYRINIWDICPFIHKYSINREMMYRNFSSFTDFAIEFLDKGYYLIFHINREFIGRGSFMHICYATGYDRINKKMYVSDHFDNNQYTNIAVNFDDINNAFSELIPNQRNEKDDYDNMTEFEGKIFLVKTRKFNYKFEYSLLHLYIDDYLNSKNSITGFAPKKEVYGLRCYDVLDDYLKSLIANNVETSKDPRIFTFFRDHKKVMRMRYEYLINNRRVEDQTEHINLFYENEKKSQQSLMLFIKYMNNKDTNNIVKIKKTYNEIKDNEIRALHNLQNQLQKLL